jgi:subtilisin family serine protease
LRADDRARANPVAWAYLDRSVIGTVQALERQSGFEADHVYSAVVRGFAARLTPEQEQALRRNPLVSYIEPDTEIRSLEQQVPWGIDRIDADLSSARSGDGTGSVDNVNVYVFDNGVDWTHPDLNVVRHVNFTFTANAPRCGHGTRTAGVIAARDDAFGVVGVVPGAPITAVKVLSCDPVITFASTVIKGIDWTRANAVRPAIANMSIGGLNNSTLDAAVRNLASSGVFVAVAAGNTGTPACWSSPQRAGTHAGVMTVAATTETDSEAGFSSFGQCVDIWAPGTNIPTTNLGGGIVTSSGTSYSAPHVAGTAGLFLSSHPSASAADVEAALRSTAQFTGTFSKDFRPVKLVYAGVY